MSNSGALEWHGVSRKAIPGVMLGMERVEGPRQDSPDIALSAPGADLAVAFDDSDSQRLPTAKRTPVLALVRNDLAADLFSWLHTFSRETSPLSQYCRVLSVEDWHLATSSSRERTFDGTLWASVIAGEMLGNGEHAEQIATTPLSWANSCLSFAIARAMLLYGMNNERTTVRVGKRLMDCEQNPRFQERRIGQTDLQPVWALASSGQRFEGYPCEEIAFAVIDAVDGEGGRELRSSKLRSSSAEQRVIGFEQVVKTALERNGRSHQRRTGGALVAAAAFLAGNGSSHNGLLMSSANHYPEAYVWFGLLVGLAGPAAWDPAWMKLAKGVQRLLGASHRLSDLPQADISWIESAWLAQLAKDASTYATVPRSNTRHLAIELLPGVSCQFRLAGLQAGESLARDPQQPQSLPKQDVPPGVHRALSLAAELQAVLSDIVQTRDPAPQQVQLFGSPQVPAVSRRRAPRAKSKS